MNKRKIVILVGFALSLVGTVLFEACRSDKDWQTEKTAAKDFFSKFEANRSSFMDAKVVVPPTRNAMDGDSIAEGNTWVYFSVPEPNPGGGDGGGTGGDPTMPLPQTVTDLLEMAANFGSDLSLDQDGSYNDSILVSDDEARIALASMVDASRSYFVSRGLTQSEITEAINECGVDETLIVPLASNFAAYDTSSPTVPDVTAYFPNPFVTYVYAESMWSKARNCAISVLGGDIIKEIVEEQAGRKLTLKIMKMAIKKYAKRCLGPVGALFLVYDFSSCLLS